jgi:Na+/H+ antiporter NhaD/arsenite permease-like protein
MIIPIIVLLIVFILIAVRQVGNFKLQIWQVMLFGAVAVIITGQIGPLVALKSINIDVMLFLFGMFVIGRALEDSGYLSHISYSAFKKSKTAKQLILIILFGFGLLSAFLMNDTIAIIGTPVVLLIAKKHVMTAKPLLLALAFAITVGSVMSPIGNPQNLLIAVNGNMVNPFITFIQYLFLPTIINLVVTYFFIAIYYKEHLHKKYLNHSQEPIKDHSLANLSKLSLILVFAMVLVKVLLVVMKANFEFKLTYIALISMIPILFHKNRISILKSIDWHTLIFFAAMFILMESVWQAGFFQNIISTLNFNILSIGAIFIVSILLSQLISNVPLVALYLPMLLHAGAQTKEMIALAAGSTIAGNLLILGAASNVIIIQNAEKRSNETISFIEFAKIGIPLTLVNTLVYWIFLQF